MNKEEKSKFLTEQLFGLKVIYPKEYFANLKGKNADYWREQNKNASNKPVIVRGNKPLKTHAIESEPMPDFYDGFYSDSYVAKGREFLASHNLDTLFIEILVANIYERLNDVWKTPVPDSVLHWELLNCTPAEQADAMVQVLMESK